MLLRTLTLLFTIVIVSAPVFAQTTTPTTPATFLQQKTQIDSLVQTADSIQSLEHAVFNGKARAGRYRVECFYDKHSREILKANYLFITDSLNFTEVYYFKKNTLVMINDNNTTAYYQVGNHLFNQQGKPANAGLSKNFNGIITDTWQGLYTALFQ